MSKNCVEDLIRGFKKLYFWQKWFFPRALQDALTSNRSHFEICTIFSKSTWWFHRIMFSCIRQFSDSRYMEIFRILQGYNLLNECDFEAGVADENPRELIDALRQLRGNYSSENRTVVRNLIISHENAANIRKIIISHVDPISLVGGLILLDKAGLLSGIDAQKNLDLLANHRSSYYLHDVLSILYNNQLFSGDYDCRSQNFFIVVSQKNSNYLADALRCLSSTGLLSQSNFNLIIKYSSILLWSWETCNPWKSLKGMIGIEQFDHIIFMCEAHEGEPQRGVIEFLNYVVKLLSSDVKPQSDTNRASKKSEVAITPLMVGELNKLGLFKQTGDAITLTELKRARKIKALELHPDKNNSLNATEEFKEMNAAFENLDGYFNN